MFFLWFTSFFVSYFFFLKVEFYDSIDYTDQEWNLIDDNTLITKLNESNVNEDAIINQTEEPKKMIGTTLIPLMKRKKDEKERYHQIEGKTSEKQKIKKRNKLID